MAEENKKKKVMVAVDESECSHYALQWALQHLTHTIVDSHLVIFTVQPFVNSGFALAATYGTAPVELTASLQDNQKKIALALLDKAKEICAKHGIVAETITEIGDPKETICEAVEKLNIELLVLGSHSRGAIGRAFLGSVSNYCVHHAKCPVLVVKKPV
ncbi:universal stress protein A-like protein isoform X1 [Ziziphus jujuba]|uniref:Universal stress protein A-like protein isoform X1 n=1 Tax=Ziziphus jujuba TaxID=326968 RepID=A0A6P4B9W3_ZIZJJ|nr:universal stress protein A-like protein isoform X1 [Ziziphus jujuba]